MDFDGKFYVDKHMDLVGLGTFEIKNEKIIFDILNVALDAGYRFIDTAQVYNNEQFIGNALKVLLPKYNLKSPANQGKEKCRRSAEESLKKLQTDYIDLFLIHWPGTSKFDSSNIKNKNYRYESWQSLESLYKEGFLKSIGVSNYNVNHLEELLKYCSVSPAVNQCEYHPHYYQSNLVDFCKKNNIHFQAYSSFGSASNKENLFNDKKICEIAKKYEVPVTDFLLAWSINQGISVLPRSQKSEHIKANIRVKNLKISNEDIEYVKLANVKKYCWNPAQVV